LILGGLFAGFCGLSHLNGMIFIAAGGALLLFRRDSRGFFIFITVSGMLLSLYFIDILIYSDFAAFFYQFTNDPAFRPEDFSILKFSTKVLHEHKRLFRKPETITLTLLFIVSFFGMKYLNKWKKITNLEFFTWCLIFFLGIITYSRRIEYMIYYFPFMSLIIANAAARLDDFPRIIRGIAALLFFAYLSANIAVTAVKFEKHDDIDKNKAVIKFLPGGGKILGPVSLAFNNLDGYKVHGLKAMHILRDRRDIHVNNFDSFLKHVKRNEYQAVILAKVDSEALGYHKKYLEGSGYKVVYENRDRVLILRQ